MKILVPSATPLYPDLPDDIELVEFDGLGADAIPPEHRDAEVLVTWVSGPEVMGPMVETLPNVKWIQALAAGPDGLIAAGVDESIRISTGTGLHDRTVSEHAVALALRIMTHADIAYEAQKAHRWAQDLARPRPVHNPEQVETFIDAKVTIWGFGSIGSHLAQVVQVLGAAQVTGIARSEGERDGFPVTTEENIDEVLGETDVLFMVLPRTEATTKALNAERLSALPTHAIVINVGRGTTVDEEALVAALKDGSIAGAGLDVTATEPLPEDSPLWDAPNTVLTPHQAGFRADGGEELLKKNVELYLAGEKLINEVER